MVEYHGWFSIHQSTDGEEEDNMISIVSEIGNSINKMSSTNRLLVLKPLMDHSSYTLLE